MHSTVTEANKDPEFRRGYDFQQRLCQARNEAGSLDRSIPFSEVTANDVLGGKGRRVMNHAGNQFFRERCDFYAKDYDRTPTTKITKRDHQLAIRLMVIDDVLSSGGRFLVPCRIDQGCWRNMIGDDKDIHLKIQNRMSDEKQRQSKTQNQMSDHGDCDSNRSPKSVVVVTDGSRNHDQDELNASLPYMPSIQEDEAQGCGHRNLSCNSLPLAYQPVMISKNKRKRRVETQYD